jgi:hypothetical protein
MMDSIPSHNFCSVPRGDAEIVAVAVWRHDLLLAENPIFVSLLTPVTCLVVGLCFPLAIKVPGRWAVEHHTWSTVAARSSDVRSSIYEQLRAAMVVEGGYDVNEHILGL